MSWTQALGPDAPHDAAEFPLWDPPPSDAPSLDALCSEAIEAYREALLDTRDDHPWAELPTEELLVRLNAAQRDPATLDVRPTRAGLLMFGYEHEIAQVLPGYLLDYKRCAADGSVTQRIVSNDGLWSGCLFDFWRRVSALLSGASAHQGLGVADAAQEGLANALVHADYAGRRHVVVTQRPDRVEFSNPGRLRVRPGAAFDGGVADLRNPMLAKMFSLVGACSALGAGLPMVRRACERACAPDPSLLVQSDPDRTTLTLYLPEGPPMERPQVAWHPRGGCSVAPESPREGTAGIRGTPPGGHEPTWSAADGTAGGARAATLHPGLFDDEGPSTAGAPFAASEAAHHAAEPRGQLGEDEASVASAMARARDGDCRAALELFRNSRRLRRADVEAALGVGSTKAKAIVAALVSDGIVEAEGNGRSTYYKLARA